MNSHLLRPGALRRLASRALAVSALALTAWGCRDSTGPAANPDDGAVPRLGQASTFYCSTRAVAPNGVREGRIPLSFPPEARSADGSTMEYRARWRTPSGAVSYSADCVIPRTIPAVEMMNQRFQVPAELGMPKGRNRSGNEITIQGCVEDGECILEPIVVVAPPPPSTCDTDCGGSGGMPGTDSGSGGWTGGAGGGGDSDSSGGGNTAGDDSNYDCHYESNPGCNLKAASSEQKTAMTTAIEKYIDQERCPALYAAALGLVNGAQVWSTKITLSGGTLRGDYSYETGQTHIWEGNFNSPTYLLPWTLAHEAAHAIGYRAETDAHPYGDSCLNFTMKH